MSSSICEFEQPAVRLSTCRTAAAFTLIELLLVTAVLAGLVALSWPMTNRAISRLELQRSVTDVKRVIDQARVRSKQRGRPQVIRIDQLAGTLTHAELQLDELPASDFLSSDISSRLQSNDGAAFRFTDLLTDPARSDFQRGDDSYADESDQTETALTVVATYRLPDSCRFGEVHKRQSVQFVLPAFHHQRGDDLPVALTHERVIDQPHRQEPVVIVLNTNGRSDDLDLQIKDHHGFLIDLKLHGIEGRTQIGERRRQRPVDRLRREAELP